MHNLMSNAFRSKASSTPTTVKDFLKAAIPNLTKDLRGDVVISLRCQGISRVEDMPRLTYEILLKTPLDGFKSRELMKYVEAHFNSRHPTRGSSSYQDFDVNSMEEETVRKPGFEAFVRNEAREDPNIHCRKYVQENQVIKVSDEDSTESNGRHGTRGVEKKYDASKYGKPTDYDVFYGEATKHREFGLDDNVPINPKEIQSNSAFNITRLSDHTIKEGKIRGDSQEVPAEAASSSYGLDDGWLCVKAPPNEEATLVDLTTQTLSVESKVETDSKVDQLENCLKSALPALSSQERSKVLELFVELGVEKLKDLELLQETELKPALKLIQIRKLLNFAKEHKQPNETTPDLESRNSRLNGDLDDRKKSNDQQLVLYSDAVKYKNGQRKYGAAERDDNKGRDISEPNTEKMVHKVPKPPRRDNNPKDVNILILGETGVGKSTLINAFANYVKFANLEEAECAELTCLIPTTFVVTDRDYTERVVKVGNDKNESGKPGGSQTRGCRDYDFNVGQTLIRLIDTPGVGDTSGVEKDTENFKKIIDHIKQFSHLNAVLILLKPNNARLTVLFRFCIQELLNHLHKSASRNIVFLFTNARSTFFRPGDTLPALRNLLRENERHTPDLNIQLDRDTIYCADNEPFRFLVAFRNGVNFTVNEKSNFVTSWNKSSEECRRLIDYVVRLKPHKIDDTVAFYDAKLVATLLTRPLCDVSIIIHRNIQEYKDMINRIQNTNAIKCLNVKVDFFDQPITVCTAPKCVNNATVHDTVLCQYSTVCYDPRVNKNHNERARNPLHLDCKTIRETKYCSLCGCRYDEHEEVYYENSVTFDKVKAIQIDSLSSLTEEEQLKKWENKYVKEVEEQFEVIHTLANVTFFLRANAITVPTDPVMERVDHILEIENKKNMAREYFIDVHRRVDFLKWFKKEYQRYLIELRQKYHEEPGRIFTPERFNEQLEKLFAMEIHGKYIEKAVNGQLRALEKKNATISRETLL